MAIEMTRPESHCGGLFQRGDFTLHSGEKSGLKIECDALSDGDIDTIAWLLVGRLPAFSAVEGVPTGGLRLADAMKVYASGEGPTLIVDDVYTTGASMDEHRGDRKWGDVIGAVIFARREPPTWVTPLLTVQPMPPPKRFLCDRDHHRGIECPERPCYWNG